MKNSVRFLSFALAVVFLLVPSLGSVLADDGAPQPSEKPRESQPAADKAEVEAIEAVEPAESGCALGLGALEPATERTSTRLISEEAVCPVADPLELFPLRMGPPFKRGFCSCSCGFQCQTDADCGGGSTCIGAITCC